MRQIIVYVNNNLSVKRQSVKWVVPLKLEVIIIIRLAKTDLQAKYYTIYLAIHYMITEYP